MPLNVEVLSPIIPGKYTQIEEIKPGGFQRTIADNKDDGTRDFYVYEWVSNSKSRVWKAINPPLTEKDELRLRTIVTTPEDFELVAELMPGKPVFERCIKPDDAPQAFMIRFTHTQITPNNP